MRRPPRIDAWLFDACYQAVGDLAETIAHVLPLRGDADAAAANDTGLAESIEQRLMPLRGQPPQEQTAALRRWWLELDEQPGLPADQADRRRVSRRRQQAAGAARAGAGRRHRRQAGGATHDGLHRRPHAAQPARYGALLAASDAQAARDGGQPYPFFLAHAIDAPIAEFESRLGPATDWLVEWKYDGIRAQAVKRGGRVWLWSRGEELVSETFPDALRPLAALPDGTVLDGELLVWPEGALQPAPFAMLQKRLNRKVIGAKLLADAPVRFVAYDLLEDGGVDLRALPQAERRARLQTLLEGTAIGLSPLVQATDWPAYAAARMQSRERGVEGFMLKHRTSGYGSGRTKAEGAWWKWKIDPMTADGVLVYAQAGHGRRASVYTDYTFAVWNRPPHDAAEAQAVVDAIANRAAAVDDNDAQPVAPAAPDALALVPFAKAYSGLTDEEFKRIDRVIRATTIEKFGPVRTRAADAGVRARLRRHPAQQAPQERHRGALSAHAAHPRRQAAARGRHVGNAARADRGQRGLMHCIRRTA